MTHETWRDVVGYEGLYQVSNLGRVRSLDRTIINSKGVTKKHRGRILRPSLTKSGHLIVALTVDTVMKFRSVESLVVDAFIPDRDKSLEIHHVNRIGHDNRLENLRLVSRSERSRLRHSNKGNQVNAVYKPEPYEAIQDLPNEEWRPVVGNEDAYEVSNMGRVRTKTRTVVNRNGIARKLHAQLLRPHKMPNGYLNVGIHRRSIGIHRLVAAAFLPHDPERNYVDHINAIRDDNRLCNLRYVTQSENNLHAVEMGNIDREKLRKNGIRIMKERGLEWCSKPVIRNDGKWYPSASEAARDIGSTQSNVSSVARGERHTAMGYSFRYA